MGRWARGLLVAVGHPSTAQIVRRKLDLDAVTLEHADVVLTHLSGEVSEDLVAVFQLDPEGRVGKNLANRPFYLDGVF